MIFSQHERAHTHTCVCVWMLLLISICNVLPCLNKCVHVSMLAQWPTSSSRTPIFNDWTPSNKSLQKREVCPIMWLKSITKFESRNVCGGLRPVLNHQLSGDLLVLACFALKFSFSKRDMNRFELPPTFALGF